MPPLPSQDAPVVPVMRSMVPSPPQYALIMSSPAHFRPGQCLRDRIELVVVAAVRGYRQFVKKVGQPMGARRNVDKAVFNGGGLSVQPHDLVRSGAIRTTFESPSPIKSWRAGCRGLVLDEDAGDETDDPARARRA
jgi:hypothetical protein